MAKFKSLWKYRILLFPVWALAFVFWLYSMFPQDIRDAVWSAFRDVAPFAVTLMVFLVIGAILLPTEDEADHG